MVGSAVRPTDDSLFAYKRIKSRKKCINEELMAHNFAMGRPRWLKFFLVVVGQLTSVCFKFHVDRTNGMADTGRRSFLCSKIANKFD